MAFTKIKVGDKVAVYDSGARFVGVVRAALSCDLFLLEGSQALYHYRQCRRIKPKAPAREWCGEWMQIDGIIFFRPNDNRSHLIPLVGKVMSIKEVRKKAEAK